MSTTSARRAVGLAGAGWGALLLLRGKALWRAATGRPSSEVERAVVAVLGARHLGQGLLQTAAPRRLHRLWLLTDLAHVASMVALAVVDPARRGPALVSAAVSAATAGPAVRAVRAARHPPLVSRPLTTPRRARRPRG